MKCLESSQLGFGERRRYREHVADLPPGVQHCRFECTHRIAGREPAVQEGGEQSVSRPGGIDHTARGDPRGMH